MAKNLYTFWPIFKDGYKRTILSSLFVCTVWLVSFWFKGELIPSVVIGIIVGSFIGLLIRSYAIDVGWTTEVICPEKQLVLRKISHLSSRYKHKLINGEWFILRTVLEAIIVSCFLMYFIGLTNDRLMDILKFLAMVASATIAGLGIRYCQKNGYL
jgi:hypothetical protein